MIVYRATLIIIHVALHEFYPSWNTRMIRTRDGDRSKQKYEFFSSPGCSGGLQLDGVESQAHISIPNV
jgi:hypothetical protein